MWRRLKLRRKWLRFLLPSAMALMIAAVAGCAGADAEAERLRSYGNDGYMGLTNTNPHLPPNGPAWSYERDGEFVQELLAGIRGIQHITVNHRGGQLNVYLELNPDLSRDEAARLTSQAENLLQENFPRYEVSLHAKQ